MKSKIYSRKRRINHLYKIINKKWQKITFKANKIQTQLMDKEKELRDNSGHVRLMILKSRQLWMTTYKCIDKLDKALFYSNINANIVAHQREKLVDIFWKVKFAYEQLPEQIKLNDWSIRNKPKAKYDNKNELYFPDNNSRIKITLDSRSWTLTDLHISELAFIDKAQVMLRWTLPSAEYADITIETTANWMNYFKYLWDNSKQFDKVFYPRYLDEWYTLQAPDNYEPIKDLSYMKTDLKLSNNQIYRYEKKYIEDPDWALQEYPTRPEDAFISTWRPFYNINIINWYKIIEWEQDDIFEDLIRYNKDQNIDCLIWIDLAEWLDHWDSTVIRVRDRDLKLIAHFKSNKFEPWDVTKVINYLHNKWIRWVIAPERNNHWHAFLYAAKQFQRYDNIYIPKQDKDDRETQKIWQRWRHTNIKTRPLMLDEHKQAINQYLLQMDEPLKQECYTFVTKNSKPQAEENCNDDVIMADAICIQMAKEYSLKEEDITNYQPKSYEESLWL